MCRRPILQQQQRQVRDKPNESQVGRQTLDARPARDSSADRDSLSGIEQTSLEHRLRVWRYKPFFGVVMRTRNDETSPPFPPSICFACGKPMRLANPKASRRRTNLKQAVFVCDCGQVDIFIADEISVLYQ